MPGLPQGIFFPSELQCILGGIADQFIDQAEIRHRVEVSDAGMGTTFVWADPPTVVPCCLTTETLSGAIGAERDSRGRLIQVTLWKVLFPLGTILKENDRFTIRGKEFDLIADDSWQTISLFIKAQVAEVA